MAGFKQKDFFAKLNMIFFRKFLQIRLTLGKKMQLIVTELV